MELFKIIKLLLFFLTIGLIFFEYKQNKKGKQTIWLPLVVMISILTTSAPWTSLIIQAIFLLIWTLFYYFKISKSNKSNIFFYYLYPIFATILSYTFGLVILYGVIAFLVLFKIYGIILALFIVSFIVYLILFFVKSLKFKFKTKKSLKISFKECLTPSFLICLILPYLALVLM